MGHVACANNAWGTLAASIGVSDVTIALSSGQGARFPATADGDWFYSTLIDSNTGALEIIKVTGRATDILTAVRGVDGTTPRAFAAGSPIELRPVAAWFADFEASYASRDGQNPMTGQLDMATHPIKNVPDPVDPQDPITLHWLKTTMMPVGMGVLWYGDWTANQAAIEAAGWKRCDGTGGTPNMIGKFLRGASGNVAGDTGGTDSITLNIGNLPAHSHGVNDGGHAHGVYDPGHSHGVNDPGHDHDMWMDVSIGPNSFTSGAAVTGVSRLGTTQGKARATMGNGTGIWLSGSGTGIGIYGSGANISIQNTGSGNAFDNRPVYLGWHFLIRV